MVWNAELMLFQRCITMMKMLMSALSLSLTVCCFLSLTLFGFPFFTFLSLIHCSLSIPPPLPLSVFLPYPGHILCAAQKITQLIIRHFVWQPANYVCTQSPIHVKVRRKRKRGGKDRKREREVEGKEWAELGTSFCGAQQRHSWFDLHIDGDRGLSVCVCFQLPKPVLGLESKDCDWLHTHLNYHLCQIHKTHILSHYRPLTEARLAADPVAVLYSTVSVDQIQIPVWNSVADSGSTSRERERAALHCF